MTSIRLNILTKILKDYFVSVTHGTEYSTSHVEWDFHGDSIDLARDIFLSWGELLTTRKI